MNLGRGLMFCFGILLCGSVRADVTGLWQGSGAWEYDGSAVPCVLSIRYQEDAQQLRRHKGSLICDVVALYSDPLLWIKSGQDLLLDGHAAGDWNETGFRSIEPASDTVEVETELRLKDEKNATYNEVWRRITDGEVIYHIHAEVSRK